MTATTSSVASDHPPLVSRDDPAPVLIIAAPDRYATMENIGRHIAWGLAGRGVAVRLLVLPRPLDALAAEIVARPQGVLLVTSYCVQSEPWPGTAFVDLFDCPIWVFAIDALHRDLHWFPPTRAVVERAHHEPRLRYLFSEAGTLADLGTGDDGALPATFGHLPHGSYATVQDVESPDPCAEPPRRRLAVIGAVEVNPDNPGVRPSLAGELPADAVRLLGASTLERLESSLLEGPAETSVVTAVQTVLGVERRVMTAPDVIPLVYVVDRWLQRRRRLELMTRLAGLRVDVYGTGWTENLGDLPGVRQQGTVSHAEIAPLMREYRGVVNLTTNWTRGLNDRVFTAASLGVPILTPASSALAAAGLATAPVLTYDERDPAVRDAAGALLETDRDEPWRPRPEVFARHSWRARAAEFFTGSRPDAEDAPRP